MKALQRVLLFRFVDVATGKPRGIVFRLCQKHIKKQFVPEGMKLEQVANEMQKACALQCEFCYDRSLNEFAAERRT